MKLYRETVSRWLLVFFILVVMALPGLCQNATWTGQIQCQLAVQSTGYAHQETQTWTISGAPTTSGAIDVYPATWSVTAQGTSQTMQAAALAAQWTTNVPGMNVPLAFFVRVSDNRLVIKSYHAQLVAPGAVTATRQVSMAGASPTQSTVQNAASEWLLPIIEDSPTSTNVSGTGTVLVSGLPMQSAGTNGTANCKWQFNKGAGGASQPVLANNMVAIPTGNTSLATVNAAGPSATMAVPNSPLQPAIASSGIPNVRSAIPTQTTSSTVPVILGHSSDGTACSQPNPLPAINSGLSHAYESTCTIKFSGNQRTSVASWNFPLDKYAIFVTVVPINYSGNMPGATSQPTYACNLVEPDQSPIGSSSISGVGSLKDSSIGLPYFAVSAVQLQCSTWTGVAYNAAATIVAIQIGAMN
jgi:hypothetical protein